MLVKTSEVFSNPGVNYHLALECIAVCPEPGALQYVDELPGFGQAVYENLRTGEIHSLPMPIDWAEDYLGGNGAVPIWQCDRQRLSHRFDVARVLCAARMGCRQRFAGIRYAAAPLRIFRNERLVTNDGFEEEIADGDKFMLIPAISGG